MDLSPRFDRDAELAVLPRDLAVLMVGVAARQAASATAAAQAASGDAVHAGEPRYRAPDDGLFRPVSGAFNGGVAAAMARWRIGARAGDGIVATQVPTNEGRVYRAVSGGVQAPRATEDRIVQGPLRPDRGLE